MVSTVARNTCGCGYMHTDAITNTLVSTVSSVVVATCILMPLQMLLIEAHVQLLLLPKQSFVVFLYDVAGFQEI